MKWFKHISDTRNDEKMSTYIEKYGFEGYGRYWVLLEEIARHMDNSGRCHVEYPVKKWAQILIMRRQKMISYLTDTCQLFGYNLVVTDYLISIEIPKMLDYLDNTTSQLLSKTKKKKKNKKENKDTSSEVSRTEVEKSEISPTSPEDVQTSLVSHDVKKEKSLTGRFDASTPDEVLKRISHSTKSRWMDLYDGDHEWIKRELIKAIGWYFDNSRKKPKTVRGWSQALSSWLERGWQYQAQKEKGSRSGKTREMEIMEAMNEGEIHVTSSRR